MTRDMELVRKILLVMEKSPDGFAMERLVIDGYDDATIGHHVYLMAQAELLTAVENTSMGDRTPTSIPLTITWQGHEFIAASRDPSLWQRAMTASKKTGNMSFPIILKLLADLAMQHLPK